MKAKLADEIRKYIEKSSQTEQNKAKAQFGLMRLQEVKFDLRKIDLEGCKILGTDIGPMLLCMAIARYAMLSFGAFQYNCRTHPEYNEWRKKRDEQALANNTQGGITK